MAGKDEDSVNQGNYNKNALFLNLTRKYPQPLLTKTANISTLFYSQSPVLVYLVPQRVKGVYKVQCKNEEDFKEMKSFKLKMKDENGKDIKEIGLEEPNKHRPKGTNNSYQNGTTPG